MNDHTFRVVVGWSALLLSAAGLLLLFFVKVPDGNNEALLLALGIVFGWGGSVVQSEFGSTSSGRNLAQVNADLVKQTAAAPTGTPTDPVTVREADASPREAS